MREIFVDIREFSAVPNFQRFNRYNQLFIGHRSLLGSNDYTPNFDKVSCLDDELDDDPTRHAANYKSSWLSKISKPLEAKIKCEISNNELSPLLVRSFFFLFISTFRGCFDAIVFSKAFIKKNYNRKITIGFGGDYSLIEIFTVIWWLKLSKLYTANVELNRSLELPKEVVNSFSVAKVLEYLLKCGRELKITSARSEIRNIFSRLKLDLIKFYKIVRTSYKVENKK